MRTIRKRDKRLDFKFESDSDLSLSTGFINKLTQVFDDNICSGDLIDPLSTIVDTSNSAEQFKFRYLLREITRKRNLKGDADTRTPAIKKFLEVEEVCRVINKEGYRNIASPSISLGSVLYKAQQIVSRILGDVDPNRLGDLMALSSGASRALDRKHGNPAFKFGKDPEFCGRGVNLACVVAKQYWPSDKLIKIVPASRLTTVPKTSSIDRCINIEPEMNMFIQKGIGSYIRERLMTVNININDQTVNQLLACSGSKTNSLATIDLASASDSISNRLVMDLLPLPWVELLMAVRSDFVTLPDGSMHELEKVASMGNGYCFELETMLFYALTQSVKEIEGCTDAISVYGDDIICSSTIAPKVIEVLYAVGFNTNDDKTFVDSKFRESCGKHYYEGIDVSPFYIRSKLDNPADILLLCNNFRRWMSCNLDIDPRFAHIYEWLLTHVSRFFCERRIPDGYGNGALVGLHSDNANAGFSFKSGRMEYDSLLVRTKDTYLPEGSLHYWFFQANRQSTLHSTSERTCVTTSKESRAVGGYRIGKISSLDFLM